MYNHEVRSLKDGKPAELVSLLYNLPLGCHFKQGYKAPNDVRNPVALDALQTYWPQTKLIVGLRHPVKWMESWYNFRHRQGKEVPSTNVMRGLASFPIQVQYHKNLAMLGKRIQHETKQKLDFLGWIVIQHPFNCIRRDIFQTECFSTS